jgi:hypothetical protein
VPRLAVQLRILAKHIALHFECRGGVPLDTVNAFFVDDDDMLVIDSLLKGYDTERDSMRR